MDLNRALEYPEFFSEYFIKKILTWEKKLILFKWKISEGILCVITFTCHFPKIHRSVFHNIKIYLLYFWDVFDVSLWEKNFGRSTAYSCRTNVFI